MLMTAAVLTWGHESTEQVRVNWFHQNEVTHPESSSSTGMDAQRVADGCHTVCVG